VEILVKKMTPSSEFMKNIEIEKEDFGCIFFTVWEKKKLNSVLTFESIFSKFGRIWWRKRELSTNGLRPK